MQDSGGRGDGIVPMASVQGEKRGSTHFLGLSIIHKIIYIMPKANNDDDVFLVTFPNLTCSSRNIQSNHKDEVPQRRESQTQVGPYIHGTYYVGNS